MATNKQRILGINTNFESINYDGYIEDSFREPNSYLDYDAVVINAGYLSRQYSSDIPNTFQGRRMISKDDSYRIVEDFQRTKTQIIELLKQGKNVFVLMASNENCFIHTGKHELDSAIMKSMYAKKDISELDTFSFLPIEITPTMVSGEKFNIICQPPYSSFFQATKDMICYDAYFDAPKKDALLTIQNSEKVISAVFKCESGKIIILPNICDEDYYENITEWEDASNRYLKALFELNDALTSTADSYSLPEWSSDIKILDEKAEEDKLDKEIKKLRDIEIKIEKQRTVIEKIQRKKILFTASGTPLEEIVKETLQEIGFTLNSTEVGRSDIIASYNGINIVAEIKGVTKSAAEKHAAQLEKWASQFIEETGHAPKSLLIVNGYCNTPLIERVEEAFPDQMLRYCIAREHALVTTTQLLCLYIEIKTNPDCAQERINELLNCVGKYQRYNEFENYLKLAKQVEAK